MKKLKIILKYNKLILLCIIILSFLFTKIYKHNLKININQNEIYGYVRKIDNNKVLIKSKENIIVYTKNNDLDLNDYVLVKGKLSYPSNNTIFNLFNYKDYLNNKKIYLTMNSDDIRIINKNKNIFYKIKNNLYKKINKYKTKKYIKIFVLGDKIDLDNKNLFNNLGIIHIFSISGFHISLICFLLRKLKCKNMIIYCILLLFLFLTNFGISSIRASLFFIFSNINKKYKLNISSSDRLIILAYLLLIINPYYIYDIGYIFSFLITYSIININVKNDNHFIKLLKISSIAFLTSVPLLINNNYSINFLSIIFNIILVPIVSYLIFPLSLLTLILPIDNYLYFITNIFEKICVTMESINIFTFSFAKLPLLTIITYYFVLFSKIKYRYLINIIMIFIFYYIGFYLLNPRVYYINVGQGDSTLIRYKNKNILIDTGGSFYDNNITKNNITFFKSIGVKKINYMIITHGDLDHCGEAINLVNNYKVEKVIFNCGPYNYLETELIKVLDKKKIKYYSCIKELNIDDNKLYFLQTKEYSNENDNSNVIYTKLNGYNFMFMGDASITTEKEILDKYNLPDIDALKVGHHGSKTSSGIEFINEINPKYSIISVGKKNRYGHPNKEVLDNLKESKIYRTDQDGSVMFKIKNNKLKIETCSP